MQQNLAATMNAGVTGGSNLSSMNIPSSLSGHDKGDHWNEVEKTKG